MKPWSMALIVSLFSVQLFAQEQMVLRLNENGIIKILKMAVQYNASSRLDQTLVIPQNTYRLTIPQSQLASNPIIPIINEISDLNMNKDLTFYLNTSEIKIDGRVDVRSLKATILNSHENGFDLRLSLSFPQIIVYGNKLSVCEDKHKYDNTCGDGLKTTLGQYKVSTVSEPVIITAVLKLRTDGKVARVAIESVTSNLEGHSSPELKISFKSIDIPKISVVIDGQETELNTTRLKDEILNRKDFLSKKLLSFAADFIANDVAEMINVYLMNTEVATAFQIFRKDRPARFDEFILDHFQAQIDNTFVRKPVVKLQAQKNPISEMMSKISEVIRSAQVDVVLNKISTPSNKDIELSTLLNFVLNGQEIRVSNSLGNSQRPLPKLNLASHRNHDINLALSEPLINGALDVVNTTQLFQEIFESISPVKGFSIRNVKLHFSGDASFVAVVNAQVDLRMIEGKNIKSWFKNKIAAWLERNNNNAKIYFPIEISVTPLFKKIYNGGTVVDLHVLSPFNNLNLQNRFNYPSNVPEMKESVKEGVMEELKSSLAKYTDKSYSIDISSFLNQAGVVFEPKSVSINQGAYLLLNLDIKDIKFNSKNPNLR